MSPAAAVSAAEFAAADGVDDWRYLPCFEGICAHYGTGTFATGLALVNAIGALAEAADHHPDVDLRYGGVTVRLRTHSADGLTSRDVDLAREISAAARELGVAADPGAVQRLDLTIDVVAVPAAQRFWRAVLGYRDSGPQDVVDPRGTGPSVWFQETGSPRGTHVDVAVPHDVAAARVAAALDAGGRLVSDAHAPAWWTLADPEGNEVDVSTWQGRG